MTRELPTSGTIHIAGRACRLPMADSVQQFAELLYSGTCAITEIPDDRWNKAPFLHPVPGTKGKAYSFAAGVLENIHAFDPAPFGISPREAEYMDPQQRHMLQVVWEALEDACIIPADLAGQNVGVYIGASMMDHAGNLTTDPKLSDSYMMTGSSLAVIANRVSHVFDLHGPSMTIDTACSSSLFALEAATKALARGEIDTAIVGATNMLLTPAFFIGFSEARMLSPTGLCQAFSDDADGYVRGEGAVAFVLRRRDTGAPALPRDYGRVVHVGLNTTGKSVNIALPSADAQFALLDKTYRDAGIDPGQLAFVEAHGTGTPVGDPIEAAALGRALGRHRDRPLPIGSVKSNIGHLEPAAGCAGLLKALIALEHGRLPPSLNAASLNRNVAFDDLNIGVARETVDLDLCDPNCRYAGVSAFGFGGANGHAILEAPDPAPAIGTVPELPASDRVFFTSAFCQASLKESANAYAPLLFDGTGQHDANLLDGLIRHRGINPKRLAILASDQMTADAAMGAFQRDERHPALITAASGLRNQPPVFLFSGNGSQYAGMSLAALECDAAYRAKYTEIDTAWQGISGWSLLEKLQSDDLAEKIKSAAIAQPLLFADQVATVAGLAARGVSPAAVLGHSGGEVAAATASGALTVAEALRVLFARATAQHAFAGSGGMAALQISEADASKVLSSGEFGDVAISAINSPQSVSISGSVADLSAFQRHARKSLRWACVRLKVDYAFHHAMQDGSEAQFRALLGGLVPAPGRVPFISSVTGIVEPGVRLNADYWWKNIREPVRFFDAVSTAAARGYRFFLEIGPDPVLASYTNDTLRELPDESAITFTGSKSDTPDLNPIQKAVVRTFVNGGRLDLSSISEAPMRGALNLQTYPWQPRQMRVHENSPSLLRQAAIGSGFYPPLGREVADEAHTWSRDVDIHLQPVLADHVIAGRTMMPAAAFADMALAAAQKVLGVDQIELHDIDFVSPLTMHDKSLNELRTSFSGARNSLRIASKSRFSDEPWRDHVRGRALPLAKSDQFLSGPAPALEVLKGDLDGTRIYDNGREIGLDYGPDFRRVVRYRKVGQQTIEVVLKPDATPAAKLNPILDPVAADAVLHGLVGLLENGRFADDLVGFLPVRIGRLKIYHSRGVIRAGRIIAHRIGERSIHADIDLFDAEGRCLARIQDARFRAIRLVQQIQTDAHVFRMDLVAMERSDSVDLPSVNTLLSPPSCSKIEDESLLLLDAIAHRIAFDALSGIRGKDGLITPPRGAEVEKYVEMLAGLLKASSLAKSVSQGLELAPEIDLAPVDVLIPALLVERPDLGSECAVLARLSAALPDLLAGRLEWTLEAVFGRAALVGFGEGSAYQTARMNEVATIVAQAISSMGGRQIRIGVVSGGADCLRGCLGEVAGSNVVVAEMGPASNFRNAVNTEPTSSHRSNEGSGPEEPFDIVVSCASGLTPNSFDPNVIELMRSGGMLVSLMQRRRNYMDVVTAIDPNFASGPDLAGLRARLSAEHGETQMDLTTKPMPLLNADLLIARKPSSQNLVECADTVPLKSLRLVRKVAPDAPGLLTGLDRSGLFGASERSLTHHVVADLWFLAPYEPIGLTTRQDAVVILAPEHETTDAGEAVLKERLLALAHINRAAPTSGKAIWIVLPRGTGYREARARNAGQAAIWAAMRTAKNEYPALDIRLIDPCLVLDQTATTQIADLIANGTSETEIVLTEDGPMAQRVRIGSNRPSTDSQTADCSAVLQDDLGGGLDSLRWRSVPRPKPGANEVLIEVAATGVNYRDVMWSMGVLPEEALERGLAGPTLGIEASGKVIEVGAGVKSLTPGDKVLSIGPASFSTHVSVDQKWVFPIPKGVSPKAAAGLPVAFFTAYYALKHLARLCEGETVLIHGGAGGVGLAAIQLARELGARVIATAGTPTKRALLRQFDVDHVVSSRDETFEADIRNLTQNRGVDVVLNGLSGRSMERSLSLLRPFGRFIELGKQDFYADTAVGLRAFKDNIAYFGADLDHFLAEKPDLAAALYREMLTLFEDGCLDPLPYRAFSGFQAANAFRTMQRSDHIGKIVVCPPNPQQVCDKAETRIFKTDPDGTLVIFGGARGLGLVIAEREMIKNAPCIVLVGRSIEPSAGAIELMARASMHDSEIRYECCDVSDRAALEKMLANIRKHRPITDIIHSAMVIEDMRMADLGREVLDRTMAAKVAGTRNLDRATRADPIRTFTVFTSMATLIGNHGQAAYVAANAYMEGIIDQRRADGLPGLAIGWGAITDTGYLSRNEDRAKLVRRMGGNIDFTARQAGRALDVLGSDHQQVVGDSVVWVSPMNWQNTVQSLPGLQGSTFRALWELGQSGSSATESGNLREHVEALSPEKARGRLIAFLKAEIARILRISEGSVQTNRAVSDAGVDSLMGVELGLAAQQALGDDIPLMTISSANSIEEIAERIAEHIHGAPTSDAGITSLLGDLAQQHLPKNVAAPPISAEATAAE